MEQINRALGIGVLTILAVFCAGTAVAQIDLTTGQPVVVVPEVPLPGGDRDYDVLWDLTHGIYLGYHPEGSYSELVSLLDGAGFVMHTTDAGIQNIDLSVYDALVICLGSAWNSGYGPAEVDAVREFMAGGGGVFVMGDNSGCPNVNINPITEAFGTTCGIGDCSDNVTNFITHPVFTGVDYVYCPVPGSLRAVPPAEEAAWADDGRLMITIAEESGPIVVIGDINFCDNDDLSAGDNQVFILNLFDWLVGQGPSPAASGTWGEIKALYR
jgi:hypothetical protein